MPRLLKNLPTLALLVIGSFVITGCGDDPELVRQNREQKAEIRRLEGELQLLRERIARAPKDQSAELAEMRESIATEEGEIETLESLITELSEKHRTMEKEFNEYKREYPIR